MFDKIKEFYNEHKDEINGAAFVAMGGLLLTGSVLLKRSNKKRNELQNFHDDIYVALKSGFNVVLDSENGDDYVVRLIDPAVAALEESKDAS